MNQPDRFISAWLRNTSGQALTEAAITLALLCMAWTLLAYTAYMGNHRILCAVAARHAAWGAGNGATVTEASIRSDVFYTNVDKVSLTTGERRSAGPDSPNVQQELDSAGSGASGLMGTIINGVVSAFRSIFPPVHTATVRFGIADRSEAAGVYPFMLVATRYPFMEDSWLENLVSVQAYCEWDEVKNTWKNIGQIFDGLVSGRFDQDIEDPR